MGFITQWLERRKNARQSQDTDREGMPDPTPSMSDIVQDNSIEGGMPELTPTEKNRGMQTLALVGAGIFAVGLIVAGLMMYFSRQSGQTTPVAEQNQETISNTQQHDFGADQAKLLAEQQAASAPPADAPDVAPIDANAMAPDNTASAPEVAATAASDPKISAYERRLGSEVLLSEFLPKTNPDDPAGETHDASSGDSVAVGMAGGSGDKADSAFANRLRPTQTMPTVATRRPNAGYLLPKGTHIACTLDTQIITTHPGFTRCLVSKDVYSADGKVLLLERGTKVVGEQTAAMLQGQARVFVLWTEAETPYGVKIALDSPAGGQLGAAGVPARMNYHFWQRFGGALMISLIGDVGNGLANRQSQGNQNITFENSSQKAQDMATEVLKNSINIPPTAYISPGSRINIMVARDIDFGTVYERVNPYLMH